MSRLTIDADHTVRLVDDDGTVVDAVRIAEDGTTTHLALEHDDLEHDPAPVAVSVTGWEAIWLLTVTVGVPFFLLIVILGTVLLHLIYP